MFDGDQLTTSRAHGAIHLRENHSVTEQINGFQPIVADWHARLTLVTVRYKISISIAHTL